MTINIPVGSSVDEIRLVERLRRNAISECGGFDVIGNMLAVPLNGDLRDVDPDWIKVLGEIVRILTVLCGDAEAAFRWLLNNPAYRAVAKDDPYYSMEQGMFWAMEVMLDWLKIVEHYRPDEILRDLFGHKTDGNLI